MTRAGERLLVKAWEASPNALITRKINFPAAASLIRQSLIELVHVAEQMFTVVITEAGTNWCTLHYGGAQGRGVHTMRRRRPTKSPARVAR